MLPKEQARRYNASAWGTFCATPQPRQYMVAAYTQSAQVSLAHRLCRSTTSSAVRVHWVSLRWYVRSRTSSSREGTPARGASTCAEPADWQLRLYAATRAPMHEVMVLIFETSEVLLLAREALDLSLRTEV